MNDGRKSLFKVYFFVCFIVPALMMATKHFNSSGGFSMYLSAVMLIVILINELRIYPEDYRAQLKLFIPFLLNVPLSILYFNGDALSDLSLGFGATFSASLIIATIKEIRLLIKNYREKKKLIRGVIFAVLLAYALLVGLFLVYVMVSSPASGPVVRLKDAVYFVMMTILVMLSYKRE